ncbi:hypothetical protein ABOONEI_2628 [Aciduliprofundum boonei T469]|nr:hypothetical protein ABOONEI_2628 [Aciduliprofundum boonei T469]
MNEEKYWKPKNVNELELSPYIVLFFDLYPVVRGVDKIAFVERDKIDNEIEKLKKEMKLFELKKTLEWLNINPVKKVLQEASTKKAFSFRIEYPHWIKLLMNTKGEKIVSYLQRRIIETSLGYIEKLDLHRKKEISLLMSTLKKEIPSKKISELGGNNFSWDLEEELEDYLKKYLKNKNTISKVSKKEKSKKREKRDRIYNESEYELIEKMRAFVKFAIEKGMTINLGINNKDAEEILEQLPLSSPFFSEISLKVSKNYARLHCDLVVLPDIQPEVFPDSEAANILERFRHTSTHQLPVDGERLIEEFGEFTTHLFSFDIPLMDNKKIYEFFDKNNIEEYVYQQYLEKFQLDESLGVNLDKIPASDYVTLEKAVESMMVIDGAKIMAMLIADLIYQKLSREFGVGKSHVFTVRMPVAAVRVLRLGTGMGLKEFVKKEIIEGE